MKLTPKQIIITAAAAVLVCTAAVLILSAPALHREYASGEFTDSPYPCTWAEQKDGSFVLTFTGELPENSTWIATTSSDAARVTQQEDMAVFTVKPRTAGVVKLWLYLREDDAPMPQGEDYTFTFSVTKQRLRLYMTFCDASAKSVAAERHETDNGCIYWTKLSSGSLLFKADDISWYAESLSGVIVLGRSLAGDSAGLEVIALEDETEHSMTLRHEGSDKGCRIDFSCTDGVLGVTGCTDLAEREKHVPSAVEIFLEEQETADAEAGIETFKVYFSDEAEALLQRRIRTWTETFGREPNEAELEELRSNIFGR